MEKVSDDLYIVKQHMRPGWFCGVIIALGTETIGLIDSGFENTPEEIIFPSIRELGRKPEEIDLVVNTHRDGDHVQGNPVIKEKTGAKIAIHELEAEAVKNVDIKLKDGDVVELGDRKFEVVHTPGHRPGNICLYDQENKLLITGDTVCGTRTDLIRMDKNLYINSLQKLAELDKNVMIMSHPFKPLEKVVLVGTEIQEMIEASINIAEKL